MSRRKKIILIILVIALLGVSVAAFSLSRLGSSEDKEGENQQQPAQTEKLDAYTSMEDGGVQITRQDVEARDKLEEFAKNAVLEHLRKEYPDSVNVLPVSTQWYFTEVNKSDNILVFADVITRDGEHLRKMLVAEIVNGYEDTKSTVKSIYPPDERYSIYE